MDGTAGAWVVVGRVLALLVPWDSVRRFREPAGGTVTPPKFPLDPGSAHAVAYLLHLLAALHERKGNRRATAEALGIPLRTFHRHLEALGADAYLCAAHPLAERQPGKA